MAVLVWIVRARGFAAVPSAWWWPSGIVARGTCLGTIGTRLRPRFGFATLRWGSLAGYRVFLFRWNLGLSGWPGKVPRYVTWALVRRAKGGHGDVPSGVVARVQPLARRVLARQVQSEPVRYRPAGESAVKSVGEGNGH